MPKNQGSLTSSHPKSLLYQLLGLNNESIIDLQTFQLLWVRSEQLHKESNEKRELIAPS
ncbi:hypothetical protein [Prochlorococcus marinus]|uniref:hypothetical protein n=1 Tax=Prochlorococcus marinus TaxID=1219 RepID=UPI00164EF129|nr:hypothetical protein [Prochlorococcus marinus]